MGLLLISHDLAVVADMADRITILRGGEVMEEGETARTLSAQVHPYTRQLAQASMHVPARARITLPPHARGAAARGRQRVAHLSRPAAVAASATASRRAVDDVSFSIRPGQSIALVGRSGCGKSTLARMVLALDRPTSGTIRFLGETLTGKEGSELRAARRNMQVVFQDPYGSFNPRHKVERLVAEPLHLLDDEAGRRRAARAGRRRRCTRSG